MAEVVNVADGQRLVSHPLDRVPTFAKTLEEIVLYWSLSSSLSSADCTSDIVRVRGRGTSFEFSSSILTSSSISIAPSSSFTAASVPCSFGDAFPSLTLCHRSSCNSSLTTLYTSRRDGAHTNAVTITAPGAMDGNRFPIDGICGLLFCKVEYGRWVEMTRPTRDWKSR